jgi:hypothetical protein
MPIVASCFLVFGLASVGFPGTLGFVGQELLVDGAVTSHPHVGLGVAIATALNGICVVRMYFALFCGARDRSTEPQRIRPREALGFATLAALLVVGGLLPRPFLDSRARAAAEVLRGRAAAGAARADLARAADLGHDVAVAVLLHGEVDLVADGESGEERAVVDGEGHGHGRHEPRDLAVLDRDGGARRVDAADHPVPGLRRAGGLAAAAEPGDRGDEGGRRGAAASSEGHGRILRGGG